MIRSHIESNFAKSTRILLILDFSGHIRRIVVRNDKTRSRVPPTAGFHNRPLARREGYLYARLPRYEGILLAYLRKVKNLLVEMERFDTHRIHALEEKRGSEGASADLIPEIGFRLLHAVLRQSRNQIGIAHPLSEHFRPQNPFRIRRPICHKRNPYDSNIIKYDAI